MNHRRRLLGSGRISLVVNWPGWTKFHDMARPLVSPLKNFLVVDWPYPDDTDEYFGTQLWRNRPAIDTSQARTSAPFCRLQKISDVYLEQVYFPSQYPRSRERQTPRTERRVMA